MMVVVVEKLSLNITINFLLKQKTKQKNITTNRGIKKTKIASQGRYEFIKINTLSIIIEGTI